MPHHCRICDRQRANEKFSGRGHRNHICKDCQRLPREQRDCIERLDELYGYLHQSHISLKNIGRLEILSHHADNDISQLATLLLEVARVKPYKRRRWKFLAQNHRDLFLRLEKFLATLGTAGSYCGKMRVHQASRGIPVNPPPSSTLQVIRSR